MNMLATNAEFTPAEYRKILSDGIRKQDFSFVIHSIARVLSCQFDNRLF